MGFESSYAARRRLAVLAAGDNGVQDALAPSLFAGPERESAPGCMEFAGQSAPPANVASHLDALAQDIVATPGAGGALLVAFAAQARALSLVREVALRTQGAALLPADVMSAVQSALSIPASVSGFELAWLR